MHVAKGASLVLTKSAQSYSASRDRRGGVFVTVGPFLQSEFLVRAEEHSSVHQGAVAIMIGEGGSWTSKPQKPEAKQGRFSFGSRFILLKARKQNGGHWAGKAHRK